MFFDVDAIIVIITVIILDVSRPLKSCGFWLAANVLLFISWEKKNVQSDYNQIVPLRHYHYSCGVEFTILVELEPLLRLWL